MKYLLIILFFTKCSGTSFIPAPLDPRTVIAKTDTLKWAVANENFIYKYIIEFGNDTNHFKAIDSVLPGKKQYAYAIAHVPGYYRIAAIGVTTFYTKPYFLPLNYSVITSPVYKTTSLSWTVGAAINTNTYLIEKSTDNKTWNQTSNVVNRGIGRYAYRLSRTNKKYFYRIRAIFKDGTKGKIINFN